MIYWLVFTTILFIGFIYRNTIYTEKEYQVMLVMAGLMTLFQGLRWNTGADWSQYYVTFEQCSWDRIFTYTRGLQDRYMEPGYMFLNVLIKTFFQHYTFFLLITCGFINYTYVVFSKRYLQSNKTLGLAIVFIFSSLFPVRQALACAVFFWAIPYLIERDWKKYFALILICYSIHYSCAILAIFYWLYKYRNKYILVGIYLSFSLLATIVPSVIETVTNLPFIRDFAFSELASRYSDSLIMVTEAREKSGASNIISISFVVFQIFAFDWYRSKVMEEDKKTFISLMMNFFVIASTARQIAMLPGLNELNRFGYYCGISAPTLLCLLSFYIVDNYERYKKIVLMLLVAFFMFKVNAIFNDYYADLFVPYYSVFEYSAERDIWYY